MMFGGHPLQRSPKVMHVMRGQSISDLATVTFPDNQAISRHPPEMMRRVCHTLTDGRRQVFDRPGCLREDVNDLEAPPRPE
jgi:hypothetical protein